MTVHSISYFPTTGNEESCQMVAGVVRRGNGMSLVLGGVGVGKTLFLKRLAAEVASDMESEKIRVASLAVVPLSSADEWLAFVASELGFIPASPSPLAWRQYLRKTSPLVILIDDADALTWEMLDEIRVWSDFGVRCVLAGNHSLEETLTHTRLVPFNQRIAARCYLETWLGVETKAFLQRELGSITITPAAMTLVHRLTDGVPRLISQLTQQLLQANKTYIDESLVQLQWNQFQAIPIAMPSSVDYPVNTPVHVQSINNDLNDDLAGTDCASIEFGPATMPPAYVYQTTEPVTPQYPCYIDKNIAMMNWIAPGHCVTSGFGTPYTHAPIRTSLDEHFAEEVPVHALFRHSREGGNDGDGINCEQIPEPVVERLERVTKQLSIMLEQLHGAGGRVEQAIERTMEHTVAAVASSVERLVDESLATPISELLEMFVDFEQECQREFGQRRWSGAVPPPVPTKPNLDHDSFPWDVPRPTNLTRSSVANNRAATACRGVSLMRLVHGDV